MPKIVPPSVAQKLHLSLEFRGPLRRRGVRRTASAADRRRGLVPARSTCTARRSWRWRSSRRSATARTFFSTCQRSTTSTAAGAPSVAPRAYSGERSRTTISTPGCSCNHAARVPAERSSRQSIGRPASRSTRDRTVATGPSPRPIIDAEHARYARRVAIASQQPKQGVPADGHAAGPGQARPRLTSERDAESTRHALQAYRRAAIPRRRPGHLLDKRPTRTCRCLAHEASHRQAHPPGAHRPSRSRSVRTYRLCTRPDAHPHPRQVPIWAGGTASMTIAPSTRTPTRSYNHPP